MTYEETYTKDAAERMESCGLLVPAKEEFTCATCEAAGECEFAWDLYNTDGDCLADK